MAQLIYRSSLLLLALLAVLVVTLPAIGAGRQAMVNAGPDNVAIKGYDPVAYFTEGIPQSGRTEFSFFWNEAEWHFASAAHRDLFAANPERYAPQFGGFCSMGLTVGELKVVDPEIWTIVDGKLYLNFSKPIRDKFRQNTVEYVQKAEQNWAKIQQQN